MTSALLAEDWKDLPVPAEAGEGKKWVLHEEFSTSFNFADKADPAFTNHWKEDYMVNWRGPGLSEFDEKHSEFKDGKLVLKASRVPDTNRVYCGIISSKKDIKYPVFMESSLKVNGLVLSSNFWMLSLDAKRELDVVECYGSDRDKNFETKMNTNYHIFLRDPASNEVVKDFAKQQGHPLPNNAPLRDGYHRFGMYWKDAWNIDFYLNGVKVRSMTKEDITDPDNLGLDRAMHIIFDVEDHQWRSDKGITVTDEELKKEDINKMFVDWVRVYTPETK